jgi:hypothetical protein
VVIMKVSNNELRRCNSSKNHGLHLDPTRLLNAILFLPNYAAD